jgi:hypothetical protein
MTMNERPHRRSTAILGWLLLALLGLSLGVLIALLPAPETGGLTRATFETIETGMTREQVERLLGGPPTQQAEIRQSGTALLLCTWEGEPGPDPRSIAIHFQDDRVWMKACFGM